MNKKNKTNKMNNRNKRIKKKLLASVLGGVLLVGCLAGCGTPAAFGGGTASGQSESTSARIADAFAEDHDPSDEISDEELFQP